MKHTLSTKATPTERHLTLAEYRDEVKAIDWFAAMSDDAGVWRRGESHMKWLKRLAAENGDEWKRVFNAEHARVFNRNGKWSTNENENYRAPFEYDRS